MDLELEPFLDEAVRELDISVTDGSVTLIWQGVADVSYGIEVSNDLLDWTSLGVTPSFESGTWMTSFPAAQAQRFLRVTLE